MRQNGPPLARAAATDTKVRFSSGGCRKILNSVSVEANYTWDRYVQVSVNAGFVHYGLLKDEEIA
jgi:hypothetical protein